MSVNFDADSKKGNKKRGGKGSKNRPDEEDDMDVAQDVKMTEQVVEDDDAQDFNVQSKSE